MDAIASHQNLGFRFPARPAHAMATATKRKGQGQDKAAAKKKKCECGKARPSFGMPGDAPKDAKWCSVCPGRVEGAVNVVNKKCECGKARPSFGTPGDAPKDAKWCSVCPWGCPEMRPRTRSGASCALVGSRGR
mmetsp:Transcript_46510/g.149231  ORF Transcript_46510/g.149231 Transcript_46510/m.149231 type:complete len:134 (+) Transcript_46510:2776-3177(+)